MPPSEDSPPDPQSYGNMGDHHWSRARREANAEAIDYYRERSRAPGVAEGGEERNHYCMTCDGVIPHTPVRDTCPHCGAEIDGNTRRYFNWVEIDEPTDSDLMALLPLLLLGTAVLIAVGVGAWLLLR